MFLWRNMANHLKITPGTPSYLEHCDKDMYAGENVHAASLGGFFYTIHKTLLRFEVQNMNVCF